jgi:hypothetical protein
LMTALGIEPPPMKALITAPIDLSYHNGHDRPPVCFRTP